MATMASVVGMPSLATAPESNDSSRTNEASIAFWDAFNARARALRDSLRGQPVLTDPQQAAAIHARWVQELTSMQQMHNDASVVLSVFDVRKVQSSIDQLYAETREARARIAPTRKFTFKSRALRAARAAARATAAPALSTPQHPKVQPSPGEATTTAEVEARREQMNEDEDTVQGLRDQVVVVGAEHRHSGSGGSIRIMNLVNCIVIVDVVTRALRIDRLQRCSVFTRCPVEGSVLLHDLSDCTLMLDSRQIRIHRSVSCSFYLRVASRPIIEHCDKVLFAPLTLRREGVAVASGAAAPAVTAVAPPPPASDMWQNVDDFGWLKVQKSPHWSVVPVEQRVCSDPTHSKALPAEVIAALRSSGLVVDCSHGATSSQIGAKALPAEGAAAQVAPAAPPAGGGARAAAVAPAQADDDEL